MTEMSSSFIKELIVARTLCRLLHRSMRTAFSQWKSKATLEVLSKRASKISSRMFICAIYTECLFTGFLAEHNLLLSIRVHTGSLFQKMFSKSEDAKQYGWRCMTTVIILEMVEATENRL